MRMRNVRFVLQLHYFSASKSKSLDWRKYGASQKLNGSRRHDVNQCGKVAKGSYLSIMEISLLCVLLEISPVSKKFNTIFGGK